MVIDCYRCKVSVDATCHGSLEAYVPDEDPEPYKVELLQCPRCNCILVGYSEHTYEEWNKPPAWSHGERLWPHPRKTISWHVPSIVRNSIQEAEKCFNASAYSACAVMCGRSLEGIGHHNNVKSQNLVQIITELKKLGIIDERIHDWGQELRQIRNLGAHASIEQVHVDDARDFLDFMHSITDYIFELNHRYKRFKERRAEIANKPKASDLELSE